MLCILIYYLKKKKKFLKTLDTKELLQMVETEMEYVSAVVNIWRDGEVASARWMVAVGVGIEPSNLGQCGIKSHRCNCHLSVPNMSLADAELLTSYQKAGVTKI